MSRRRPRIALLTVLALLAVGCAGLLSACGGDDEDAQTIVDRAFSEPIESADISVSADLAFEGSEQLSDPLRLQVSGPYRSEGPERIPSFDVDVGLQGAGADVPPIGLISTGDNIFVEVQEIPYEVGEDVVAEQNRQLAEQAGESSGLAALGVDPRDWIVDAAVEEGTEVAGEPTSHVSAAVDVPALLTDLNEAAQQAAAVGAGPAPELTEEQRAQLEESVEDPTFDVFASEEDGGLRRLTASVRFSVPEDSQAELGGATAGTLSFSLELANVNGGQEITAPENAQPLADLAQQLGGLLGGQPQGGGALQAP